jgi:hypothetical protein
MEKKAAKILPLSPDADGLLAELWQRLGILPSELVVVSALLVRVQTGWRYTHASVLVGPAKMGALSWGDWGRSELQPNVQMGPAGLPGEFRLESGSFMAVRQRITVAVAKRWLRRVIADGTAPALGRLPEAQMRVKLPRAPVLARPYNETPAGAFVLHAARPVVGFLFAGEEPAADVCADIWEVDGERVHLHDLLGMDLPTDREHAGPPTRPGLLLGRVSRRAWIARVSYRREEEQFQAWLRMERRRIDPYQLEIEIREYVDGDLADSRRLRLADVPLPARVRGRLGLNLPTLGRGLSRDITLYHRDGELLDTRTNVRLVESIGMTMTVNGHRLDPVIIGERRAPATVIERLGDLARVEEQYDWWLSRGARRRLISGRDFSAHLTRRLGSAVGELLILDSYFGIDAADYNVLSQVSVPVRILTGKAAIPPPATLAQVQARAWQSTKTDPIPWHDRFYFWDGDAGLNVGTSPNGLAGRRLFRVDELSRAEVKALRASFDAWWADARARAI